MNEPQEPAQPDTGSSSRLAAPLRLHRHLGPLAGLALLAGLLALGLSWREHRSGRLEDDLLRQRDQLALDLTSYRDRLLNRLDAALDAPAVAAALQAGRHDQAVAALRADWPELQSAHAYAPDLGAVLESEPQALRYGRLALVQRALVEGRPMARAIRGESGPVLALAARASHEGRVLGVVLVELPLSGLTDRVVARTPSGGYLGLKQGRTLLAEHGAAALAPQAEMRALHIAQTPWRLVASAPAAGSLPVPSAALMALGALLLVLAALAVVMARRPPSRARGEGEEAADDTLAEVLRQAPKPEPPPPTKPKPEQVPIERDIFRAYDVRGIVGKNLDAHVARLLGQAIGSLMHEQGLKAVVVGRDGRHSGPDLSRALIEGLRAAGREVIDIGQATTPLVYFAGFHLRTGCGVAVTGSHNPPDYNGFKIVVGGETLYGPAIQALYERIAEDRLHTADTPGTLRNENVLDAYVRRIAEDIQVERRLKVVVDCGNGVAGAVAPAVLEAIGCEVVPLFCDVDGDFPNHHPDPSEPGNLADLIQMVKRLQADIGLAFDGDGDRLGVVTDRGKIIHPDRVLMLFAQDVLGRNPGACILYDVKCTGHLAAHILRHGGSPVMWKTGHSLMKAKMRETEAELAGEMSGHFFFRERWYGFDDGVYAGARLLEILATGERSAEAMFAALPESVSTPELKVPVAEGEQAAFVERLQRQGKFEGARIATIDGIRADWPDGWGLVRASNTTPVLVLRFEAENEEALERIQAIFRKQMLAIAPDLKLPF